MNFLCFMLASTAFAMDVSLLPVLAVDESPWILLVLVLLPVCVWILISRIDKL